MILSSPRARHEPEERATTRNNRSLIKNKSIRIIGTKPKGKARTFAYCGILYCIMQWSTYLARGAEVPIYHMCDEKMFEQATANNGVYYSATFEHDGFIHASSSAYSLLEVGTYFYKSVVGQWVCLKLNPAKLTGPVVYEAPAPVGSIEAFDHKEIVKVIFNPIIL